MTEIIFSEINSKALNEEAEPYGLTHVAKIPAGEEEEEEEMVTTGGSSSRE